MQHIFLFLFIILSFFSVRPLPANEVDGDDLDPNLRLDKNGIKIFIYKQKQSKFATFKATTYIESSLDSILALMFDNKVCPEWVYACVESFVIKNVSFNERYHYQISDIPFPFNDREFIFHSIMEQEPVTKIVTITMSAKADYCNNKQSSQCEKIKNSEYVRVSKSIGTYQLEPDNDGTKITWIQHTDPAGNLPSWLVNQFIVDMPYWTLKKLAEKVKEEKYKYAKLIYDKQGIAIALNIPKKPLKSAKDFPVFPTF